MLDIKLTICFFLLLVIVLLVNKCDAATNTYQIVSINGGVLELNNKKHYCLDGIAVKANKKSEVEEFIKKASRGFRVIVEPTHKSENSIPCAVIYIFGNGDLNRQEKESDNLRGFTDVRMGFWNTQKGIAINLNKLLIKKGLVEQK